MIKKNEELLAHIELQLKTLYVAKKSIEDKIAFFKSDKYQEWDSKLQKELDYKKPYKD